MWCRTAETMEEIFRYVDETRLQGHMILASSSTQNDAFAKKKKKEEKEKSEQISRSSVTNG